MIATTCDYCGQTIDDDELYVTITVNGQVPDDGLCGREHEGGYIGHYHSSEREDGEPACYWRLRDAIDLVHEWAGTLAGLPVTREDATPSSSAVLGWSQSDCKRRSAITGGTGGIGTVDLPNGVYGPLVHANVLTLAEVKRRVADGTIASVKGLGPSRRAALTKWLETHEAGGES